MSKLKTIGENPLDAVFPSKADAKKQPETNGKSERITFQLPADLTERLRNAAFWTPGTTMAQIVQHSVYEGLVRLEKQRGQPFPPRKAQLRPGRRVTAE